MADSWVIGGAIGIVAGLVLAPVAAVPVAVALGVGGGALSFSAVVAGIIATSGTIGAVAGLAKDDEKRAPDNGKEVIRIFKGESAKDLLSHILDYQTREISNVLKEKDEDKALESIRGILSSYKIKKIKEEKIGEEKYEIKATKANLAKILGSKYRTTDSHENANSVWNLSSSFKILYLGALNSEATNENKIKALKFINQIQKKHTAEDFYENFEEKICAVNKDISERRIYLEIVGKGIALNPPDTLTKPDLNYLFSESFKDAHKDKSPSNSPEKTNAGTLGPNCLSL